MTHPARRCKIFAGQIQPHQLVTIPYYLRESVGTGAVDADRKIQEISRLFFTALAVSNVKNQGNLHTKVDIITYLQTLRPSSQEMAIKGQVAMNDPLYKKYLQVFITACTGGQVHVSETETDMLVAAAIGACDGNKSSDIRVRTRELFLSEYSRMFTQPAENKPEG